MKTIVVLLMLFGMFSCSSSNHFKSVSADEFQKVIQKSGVICLDVRTADEYCAGHIAGAVNIDVKRDDFENIATSRLPKDKTIAVYCRSGNRSKKACSILTKHGYRKIVELDSGIIGWQSAGKGVE